MLIVITGSATIHKQGIAYEISRAFNNYDRYEIDGYFVDYTKDSIEVYNANGELVCKPASDDVEGVDKLMTETPLGPEIAKKIFDFKDQIVLESIKTNHYHESYNDLAHDIGTTTEVQFEPEANYEEFLTNYNNRVIDTQVITGLFSKSFINKVRADIGDSNVHVVVVNRNPSAAYVLDKSAQENGIYFDPQDFIGQVYYESVLNMLVLKDLTGPNVQHVNFETLLLQDSIEIAGKHVNFGSFENYNGTVSQYENTELKNTPEVEARAARLETFNSIFSQLRTYTKEPWMPGENVFEELGYAPLTYGEIFASPTNT